MKTAVPAPGSAGARDAARAGRAMGAMVLFPFGGVWIGVYAWRMTAGNPFVMGAVVLAALALGVFAWRRYRRHRPALAAIGPTSRQKRAMRIFHIVNAGQWIAIFVAINILVRVGLPSWEIPCVIAIVGLHFLPLAHVFNYRAHYLAGAALVALAMLYPLLAPHGPADPVGCLGAGLILWASAFLAVTVAGDRGRANDVPQAA
ncbi:MAG: hypothetical protein BGP23_12295 [Lysobacterales bacterium 66-474]|nr:MAG: hypothetical protein ABT18_04155 [Rhodanobacter sp. SCN 66-43]OJY86934.1 MAG: hypothetical protein BGP23_12295 [Xanthomonadales bacterium 66-474]